MCLMMCSPLTVNENAQVGKLAECFIFQFLKRTTNGQFSEYNWVSSNRTSMFADATGCNDGLGYDFKFDGTVENSISFLQGND